MNEETSSYSLDRPMVGVGGRLERLVMQDIYIAKLHAQKQRLEEEFLNGEATDIDALDEALLRLDRQIARESGTRKAIHATVNQRAVDGQLSSVLKDFSLRSEVEPGVSEHKFEAHSADIGQLLATHVLQAIDLDELQTIKHEQRQLYDNDVVPRERAARVHVEINAKTEPLKLRYERTKEQLQQSIDAQAEE